ncbi:hypothetical protein SAMN05216205_0412 [Pseudomonas mohnii]|uniref:Uncharacterized protein n=1 Tax=Pseudomonas mohnii TaxID=395600 RepID=A0ABY0XMX1_9PSED|nr:hypothetical protein SAMN05216205_0412 [Pseudomonas mohnii]
MSRFVTTLKTDCISSRTPAPNEWPHSLPRSDMREERLLVGGMVLGKQWAQHPG